MGDDEGYHPLDLVVAQKKRIAELEAERPLLLEALWVLLDGREVVVRPRDGKRHIVIHKTDDGGFLIRRAKGYQG